MADYNKLPIAIVIPFTYKYFDHLDAEIIVKLHTPKTMLLICENCTMRAEEFCLRRKQAPRKYRRAILKGC